MTNDEIWSLKKVNKRSVWEYWLNAEVKVNAALVQWWNWENRFLQIWKEWSGRVSEEHKIETLANTLIIVVINFKNDPLFYPKFTSS